MTTSQNNVEHLPTYEASAFTCPFCHVLTEQVWTSVGAPQEKTATSIFYSKLNNFSDEYRITFCAICKKSTIWDIGTKSIIHPKTSTAPPPTSDMPEEIKKFYEEARQVQPYSSRATAALLRIAIEQLTKILVPDTTGLNQRIAELKKKGLRDEIIKALDIVRVTGNEGGAHLGTIDLTDKDGKEIVNRLFRLTNMIVENVITQNKEINEWFDNLPESKRKGIKNRDKNSK